MSRANFVQVQLSAEATSSQDTLTVAAPDGGYVLPPADGGRLILTDSPGRPAAFEIVTYTSRTGTGPYTLSGVVRAQEGTADRAWPVGSFVMMGLTAGELESLLAGKLDANANAASASKLQTPRTINGVDFDGSANITVSDDTKFPRSGGTVTGAVTVKGSVTGDAFALADERQFNIASLTAGNLLPTMLGSWSDICAFRKPIAAEYFDGMTWVDWASKLPELARLFDGMPGTSVDIPAANKSFRFVMQLQGWHNGALWQFYQEYVTNGPAAYNYKIERCASSDFASGVTVVKAGTASGSPYFNNFQGSSHSTETYYRFTIEVASDIQTKWVWMRGFTSRLGYGAFTGLPFTWDVDKRVTFTAVSGDGSGLTNLDAGNLASGTVPSARLSGSYGISVTGNAATASKLATARSISGVPFDGTADITIPAVRFDAERSLNVGVAGWVTIATCTTGRAYGEFLVYDVDSGRHNFVKIIATASFGVNTVEVQHGTRFSSRTIAHVRILYQSADQTYGGAKLQVYCENPPFTLRVRSAFSGQINGWHSWDAVTPILESPAGWVEDPSVRTDDITHPLSNKGLPATRANWEAKQAIGQVVGQLVWRNYGNGHTIFDASDSLTPTGAACDYSKPTYAWAPGYPTLMGYNGTNTYGVKVSKADHADEATASQTALRATMYGNTTNCNSHFLDTPPGQRTFQEGNSMANAPTSSWGFIESIRHSNASSIWGIQYYHCWENLQYRRFMRNISAGTFGGWVEDTNSDNFKYHSAGLATGGVGSFGLFAIGGGGSGAAGALVAGSSLRYAAAGWISGTAAEGTWKLMGAVLNADGASSDSITMCLRIS